MKLLLSLFVVLTISACSIFETRRPSSAATGNASKVHYVITLHGVRGNAESYGDFHNYVGDVLSKIDPSYEYKIINWTYPVGGAVDDKVKGVEYWNPYTIADRLNQEVFLKTNCTNEKECIAHLGSEDKISFIAYSMGGQMIMSWYYNTMFNFPYNKDLAYSEKNLSYLKTEVLPKVENIVGLGPVYWGSHLAEFGWSIIEKGELVEMRRLIPILNSFCEKKAVTDITKDVGIIENAIQGVKNRINSDPKVKLTDKEKNNLLIENMFINICGGVKNIKDSALVAGCNANKKGSQNKNPALCETFSALNSDAWNGLRKLSPTVLKAMYTVLKSKAFNTSPTELKYMSITSDLINQFRQMRMKHLIYASLSNQDPALSEFKNYKAKWTNIVGIFPCLRKTDSGLTCKEFEEERFKTFNDQLKNVFTGLNRLEADGPVFGSGGNADFIFYKDEFHNPKKDIVQSDFTNTADLQNKIGAADKNIFVENQHADVIPALNDFGPPLSKLGSGLRSIDKNLDQDVVIMNKECAQPETCKHPNFKNIIEVLTGCTAGNPTCNSSFMNKYFFPNNEKSAESRYDENNDLAQELGAYGLILNLRLPIIAAGTKQYDGFIKFLKDNNIIVVNKQGYDEQASNIGKYVNFETNLNKDCANLPQDTEQFQNCKEFNNYRTDLPSDPYANQIGRFSEAFSSHAVVSYDGTGETTLRIFIMGRVWSKNGSTLDRRLSYDKDIPVKFRIKIPGFEIKNVEAKIRSKFTTYADLYMQAVQ